MKKKDMDYNEVLDYLEKTLLDEKLLSRRYAGAEIPNYICSYHPEENESYNKMAKTLVKRLEKNNKHVLLINVYDVMFSMLEKSGDLEDYLNEPSLTHEEIMEDFNGILDNDTEFAPEVARIINEESPELVLINGIGEAWPFIRIHGLLEILPNSLKRIVPIVIFYPGKYDRETGSSALQLFDRLPYMNYYRAFNIFTEVRQ